MGAGMVHWQNWSIIVCAYDRFFGCYLGTDHCDITGGRHAQT
jgi:hypothetical protein